jgi:hypothetical protein
MDLILKTTKRLKSLFIPAVSIRETMSKVKELSTGFASIDAQLNDPNGDAKFKSVMGAFVSKAKETLQQIEDRGTKLEPAFKETLAFYGEPPATETEDFFGTWSAFVNGLNKARQDNQKRVELQAKEEKTRALQAELKKQVGVGGLKKKGQLEEAIQDLQVCCCCSKSIVIDNRLTKSNLLSKNRAENCLRDFLFAWMGLSSSNRVFSRQIISYNSQITCVHYIISSALCFL